MQILEKLSRAYDKFLKGLFYVPAAMILALVIICAAMVCLRKVLIGAFNWADEAMRFLMVYATFLSLPLLVDGKKNITIDLTNLIFKKNKAGVKAFHILAELLTMFCCVALAPALITFMKSNMQGFSPAMHLPMWLVYSCLPLGFGLSILSCLNNLYKLITASGEEVKS